MATHPCPKCQADAFTWHLDEEASPLTQWRCWACEYSAQEDESEVRDCAKCGARACTVLRDDSATYVWCSRCSPL